VTDQRPEVEAALAEIKRQRRLVDQMSTMHSLMRDRARVQGVLLVCVVLVASVVATAFAFAGGDDTVSIFGVEAKRSTWLGWFAVATFSLTLVDLVLDRRGVAGRYGDAVRQLSTLKAEYRTMPPAAVSVEECSRLTALYQAAMEALPPLPERLFNRLKAKHLEKVEISRYLSNHPGLTARQARQAVRAAARST
jgi:hypothetical protein